MPHMIVGALDFDHLALLSGLRPCPDLAPHVVNAGEHWRLPAARFVGHENVKPMSAGFTCGILNRSRFKKITEWRVIVKVALESS